MFTDGGVLRYSYKRFGVLAGIFGILVISLIFSESAHAFPGLNGRIGYVGGFPSGPIESVLPDGSSPKTISDAASVSFRFSPDGTQLAYGTATPTIKMRNYDGTGDSTLYSTGGGLINPTWSPFGDKVLFTRSNGTYILSTINPDGTGHADVTSAYSIEPDWSPDGSKVVFLGWNGNTEIYTMDADGTDLVRLTNTAGYEWQPRWSPDGSKILYRNTSGATFQIYTMDADGTDVAQLTNSSDHNYSPAWSPDGTKIAFTRLTDSAYDIYTMNANGSNQTAILTDEDYVESIDWQPITEAIDAADGSLVINVNNGGVGSIDITDAFYDPYDGPDPASVEVTVDPIYGTATVNNTTGVVTYTQSDFASSGGFLTNLANMFFTPVSAAPAQETFRINVCSSSSSELCSFGIITVNLASASSASSTSLADTGENIAFIGTITVALLSIGLYGIRRLGKK